MTRANIIINTRAKDRPGQYNLLAPMADRYRVEVDVRETIVPFPQLSSTTGDDHISMHREKKNYQREEQTVVKTCRPNSKRTQLSRM
jgi:hypothetical protein